MKKFIFGLMLLVSMLGIVGCADPNNSDDPAPAEVGYTIYNETGIEGDLSISYLSSSGIQTTTVKNGESCTIKTKITEGSISITCKLAEYDQLTFSVDPEDVHILTIVFDTQTSKLDYMYDHTDTK